MDGLALLCTLYGDGPVTLRRLREAGWNTVERLEGLDPQELADEIGLPVDQARRLQREARSLSERVDGFPAGLRSTAVEGLVGRLAPEGPALVSDPLEPSEAALEPEPEPAPLDAAAPVPETPIVASEPAPRSGEVDAAGSATSRPSGAEDGSGWLIPHRAQPEAPRVASLDGVDAELAATFERAGIRTLEDLTSADEIGLVRDTDVPLTRILRLRFLARRALAGRSAESPPSEPAPDEPRERFSPSERSFAPLPEPPTGGPFA